MIHATDADMHARWRCSEQARDVQHDYVAGCCRMARVIVDQLVGIALIVRGLDHGRLRIHVKQDRRDGIASR